ncbi:MAG: hypothetical protein AAGJ81_08200 [Verrucomicrobiota bacterium]
MNKVDRDFVATADGASGEAVSRMIQGKELAKHWGVSPAMVSKLKSKKNMPAFSSLDQADEWARKHHPAILNGSVGVTAPGVIINFEEIKAGAEGKEFEDVILGHAEEIPLIAHRLYQQAAEQGSVHRLTQSLDLWNKSAKVAGEQRLQWLAIQEKSGMLLDLDRVLDVVGNVFQPHRSELLTLPSAIAVEANPENPGLAKAVIEKAIQAILEKTTDRLKSVRPQFEKAND